MTLRAIRDISVKDITTGSFLLGEERINLALAGRSLVLVTSDDEPRRAAFIKRIACSYDNDPEYRPVLSTTPRSTTDAALMRAINLAVGLSEKRTRYRLWQDFEGYCTAQYDAGRRVLLIFEDAHLMNDAMLRLLHSLSTVVVKDDLAVPMILSGGSELERRLQQMRHRALCSRIGAHVRLRLMESRAA